ncbi:MAG: hypothetical protein GOU98_04375 [Candidatus Altiarchaeota archaeon]|nr:hypothetical protein [Candidatus Altiarchaeota archaeon]
MKEVKDSLRENDKISAFLSSGSYNLENMKRFVEDKKIAIGFYEVKPGESEDDLVIDIKEELIPSEMKERYSSFFESANKTYCNQIAYASPAMKKELGSVAARFWDDTYYFGFLRDDKKTNSIRVVGIVTSEENYGSFNK